MGNFSVKLQSPLCEASTQTDRPVRATHISPGQGDSVDRHGAAALGNDTPTQPAALQGQGGAGVTLPLQGGNANEDAQPQGVALGYNTPPLQGEERRVDAIAYRAIPIEKYVRQYK